MQTGLAIYANQLERLLEFYQTVVPFELMERDADYALLKHGDFELVLLETEVSKDFKSVEPSSSPREQVALKPTFFVDSDLESLAKKIHALGGGLREPKDWTFGGRQVCDGWDSEGNIFQLRLKADAKLK